MKKIILLLFLIFTFTIFSFAQKKKNCKAEISANSIRCASVVNVFDKKKVRELKGKVNSPLEIPIIFEIYKIKKKEVNESPYKLTQYKEPNKIFETDENGEFCIKNFPEGYYVLRFGTSDGGWNCSWIIVEVSKDGKDKKIEVDLDIGI